MKQASSNIEAKRAAGQAAAQMVCRGMKVGVGTGSTALTFIEALAVRNRLEDLQVEVVPTSFQSKAVCIRSDLRVLDPAFLHKLDLCVDGADQVDSELNAIKGGGACHTIEKVVASLADRYILAVDESKLVTALGDGFPVPIEVLPAALGLVMREITRLGYDCALRSGTGKDGPVTTDQANLVLDMHTGPMGDPVTISRELDRIPGLVGHGLFVGMVDAVVVGRMRNGEAVADVVSR